MYSKKLLFVVVALAASAASTSALAVTRSCNAVYTIQIVKNQREIPGIGGRTQEYKTVSGTGGTVFLARKSASSNAISYFNSYYKPGEQYYDTVVQVGLSDQPRGAYEIWTTASVTGDNGCANTGFRKYNVTK